MALGFAKPTEDGPKERRKAMTVKQRREKIHASIKRHHVAIAKLEASEAALVAQVQDRARRDLSDAGIGFDPNAGSVPSEQ